LHTNWGRVGDKGQSQQENFTNSNQAILAFEKKFSDKTGGNKWDDRDEFEKIDGKYQLVAMKNNQNQNIAQEDSEEEYDMKNSILDKKIQQFIKLIFSSKMFEKSMTSNLKIDLSRLPLGILSESQIDLGKQALVEIENELNHKKKDRELLKTLSSKYYSLIPTDCGRSAPPVIDSMDFLLEKFNILNTLSDIESAQQMMKNSQNKIDSLYSSLNAELKIIDRKSKEFQIIETFVNQTKNNNNGLLSGFFSFGQSTKMSILDVFSVNRKSDLLQKSSFFNQDKNRKLLFHGTDVSVVAAILKSGLVRFY